jgi:dienelactone hydrolase
MSRQRLVSECSSFFFVLLVFMPFGQFGKLHGGSPTAVRSPKTLVSIDSDQFRINGELTYRGRVWKGQKIEGLLMNSRMVQATFDDRNPETRLRWAYPDTKAWDANRNTQEFLDQMENWRKSGLLCMTVNLQGGSPEGYSRTQPWHNSGINSDGSLEPKTMDRMKRVIQRADDLGMVLILGLYYFGQDQRIANEASVIAGVDNTIDWIVENRFTNLLIEINNECDAPVYDHDILKPGRVHELIERSKARSANAGLPLLVGTSYGGNKIPTSNVVKSSDFLLIHGNGVKDPKRIVEMVRETRLLDGYRPMPILFNEDDHFDFDKDENNFTAAISEYASWVNWKISSDRKRGFQSKLQEITGSKPNLQIAPNTGPDVAATTKSSPLKDLDGHFPWSPSTDIASWEKRSDELRMQLKVSLGMWPMPTLPVPSAKVYGTVSMEGYSVSKITIPSLHGLIVTGSLYTPAGHEPNGNKKVPAILCPHGHWDNGRFYHASDKEVGQLLATGAERFESAARNHMQARCVQLARMGCIVLQYDMLGYADSQQISLDRAHRFGLAGPNPSVDAGKWLLYSPEAEGHLQSVMGLQTINTLQAFEYLHSRTDVDPKKIAITGASGGGTQSFVAAALEPRIAAAFPAVMVSTGMQGGCTCENACCLRVGTGNVEIAALIAPRPLGLTAADDWTRSMPKDGYPELVKHFAMLNAKDRLSFFPAVHFPHNFNHVSRVAFYGFVNKHFGLGLSEPILETDFQLLRKDQLTVWDVDHPIPPSGIEFEADMLQKWRDDTEKQQLADPRLKTAGWSAILKQAESIAASLTVEAVYKPSGIVEKRVVDSNGIAVGGLFVEPNKPATTRLRLLDSSDWLTKQETSTMWVGDSLGLPLANLQPKVKNPRPAGSYTYGYNPPQMVRRLGVLLSLIDNMADSPSVDSTLQDGKPLPVVLETNGSNAVLAKAAAFLRPTKVSGSSDPILRDVSLIDSIYHPDFVPGALRYAVP